jgi:hypothetical protein
MQVIPGITQVNSSKKCLNWHLIFQTSTFSSSTH